MTGRDDRPGVRVLRLLAGAVWLAIRVLPIVLRGVGVFLLAALPALIGMTLLGILLAGL